MNICFELPNKQHRQCQLQLHLKKIRILSTLPAAVNVNESLKKVKQNNPTGSGSSSSTTKSESISPKILTSSPIQQSKTGVPTVCISAPITHNIKVQHPSQ
ncbi:13052_t:CDS:2 [Cetraspora pellucida]|uniref:13052_t:CDS:1 n=1 Tax=Cetraspora pellucida TaxID=1433469 RepID=A0A9N9C3N3_9GLOM|nr:13052_t:CDS:2 [Cetraspora pellucida]